MLNLYVEEDMKKIKNAIIIDGVTYELVKFGDRYGMCRQCDLINQCKEQHDTICNLFPLSDTAQYHFKKVNALANTERCNDK